MEKQFYYRGQPTSELSREELMKALENSINLILEHAENPKAFALGVVKSKVG